MSQESLTKVKRIASRLSYEELCKLKHWVEDTKHRKWSEENKKKKAEHIKKITRLEPGSRVIVTYPYTEMAGQIGEIVRHLGRGSLRSLVRFEDGLTWRLPRAWLSEDTSKEAVKKAQDHVRLNRAGSGIDVGRVLIQALNNINDRSD